MYYDVFVGPNKEKRIHELQQKYVYTHRNQDNNNNCSLLFQYISHNKIRNI